MKTLIEWYKGKIAPLEESKTKDFHKIYPIQVFYLLKKSEGGDYKIYDWDEEFKKFLTEHGISNL